MDNVEELVELNNTEKDNWEKWTETKDSKYMNVILWCQQKRAKILNSRKNSLGITLQELDSKG